MILTTWTLNDFDIFDGFDNFDDFDDFDHFNDIDNFDDFDDFGEFDIFDKGSCTYYVITDRGGSLQMITVLHRGAPAYDYGIT